MSFSAHAVQPNILLIVADDLGYGDLSGYGASMIATPNIDRLAREGVRFTDAHAPNSICAPTRFSILSGAYFMRGQEVWDGRLLFHEGQLTLPQLLGSAGYRTAAIGKWHLGFGRNAVADWNGELRPGPLEVGFDYFFGTPNTHNEPPWVFVENHRVFALDEEDPIRLLSHQEAEARDLRDYGWGVSQGASQAHAARPWERIDPILADKAVEFLEQQESGTPFFLYLAFLAPHGPQIPSPEFAGSSQVGAYGDVVQQLDSAVGRVMESLSEKGLEDDTLVIFTSDNGAMIRAPDARRGHRANAGLLGQKTDAWEGGHRVPLIARWPGHIPESSQAEQLFGLNDLFRTLASAAGAVVPAGAAPDSIDQLGVLTAPHSSPSLRHELLIEGTECFALRQGHWVFLPMQGSCGLSIHPEKGQRWKTWSLAGLKNSDIDASGKIHPSAPDVQLYDLKRDPGQAVNQAASEPARVEHMVHRFEELAAECHQRKWYTCPRLSSRSEISGR